MSVEGLQKLAGEMIGSSNPPFRVFGERIREELEGVQDVCSGEDIKKAPTFGTVQEAVDSGRDAVVDTAGDQQPDEAPLQGAGDTPDEQTPEEPQDNEEPPTEEATDPDPPAEPENYS